MLFCRLNVAVVHTQETSVDVGTKGVTICPTQPSRLRLPAQVCLWRAWGGIMPGGATSKAWNWVLQGLSGMGKLWTSRPYGQESQSSTTPSQEALSFVIVSKRVGLEDDTLVLLSHCWLPAPSQISWAGDWSETGLITAEYAVLCHKQQLYSLFCWFSETVNWVFKLPRKKIPCWEPICWIPGENKTYL